MCGFCGVYAPGVTPLDRRAWVEWGSQRMKARGPDDDGFWADEGAGVALGFRRLAVLDPTPAGHQPMVDEVSGSVLVFNGEIYNHRDLRTSLERDGVAFRSRSDTEVLLQLLVRHGEAAVERLNGMFSFAFLDGRSRELVLARDHAGIKPLFVAWSADEHSWAFASQYDVVARPPWGSTSVDPDALALYFRLHHVPPPYGLYQRTGQLEPGECVVIDRNGHKRARRWWTLPPLTEDYLPDAEVGELVDQVVARAVDRQLVADRPLGSFLSGGIDSPLVTAVAAGGSASSFDAFTIGVPGWKGDEGTDAARFAQATGVRHHLLSVGDEEVRSAFEAVVSSMHEPIGDFSILPTSLVSRLASEHVVVALSGDGGDELFFGYERPWSLLRSYRLFALPRSLRRLIVAGRRFRPLAGVSGSIASADPGSYYFGVNGRTSEEQLAQLVPGLGPPPAEYGLYRFEEPRTYDRLADFSRRVEYHGQLQRVLRKVDVASMSHSLEVRVPLLDREVVDLSARIDPRFNLRGGVRKGVLVDALQRRLPSVSLSREKRGFGAPLGTWLTGPLARACRGCAGRRPRAGGGHRSLDGSGVVAAAGGRLPRPQVDVVDCPGPPLVHYRAMSGTWLLFACSSPYAAEAAEVVWRLGAEALLVDNLPDGPQPSALGSAMPPADIDDATRELPRHRARPRASGWMKGWSGVDGSVRSLMMLCADRVGARRRSNSSRPDRHPLTPRPRGLCWSASRWRMRGVPAAGGRGPSEPTHEPSSQWQSNVPAWAYSETS